MNHTFSSLPVFRLIGLQAVSDCNRFSKDFKLLLQQWENSPAAQALQGFSSSLYAACHYAEDDNCRLLVGRLADFDTPVAPDFSELYVPPQQYAVCSFDSNAWQELPEIWEQVGRFVSGRRRHTDFAVCSSNGTVRFYIGIEGDVEMAEGS